MILVDANLLIYAFIEDFNQHEAAKAWLDSRLSSTDRVGLPWGSLLAFVRIASNPRFGSWVSTAPLGRPVVPLV